MEGDGKAASSSAAAVEGDGMRDSHQPDVEIDVAAWVAEVADRFVNTLSGDFLKELERVTHAHGVLTPEQRSRIVKAFSETVTAKDRARLSRRECAASFRAPARKRRGRQSLRKELAGEPRVILSESNREHLKCIAATMVSEMIPEIRRLVAADPRIERFSLGNSARYKKGIIDKYKAELKAKRKNEIEVLTAAQKLMFSGVSVKSFASVRSVLVGLGLGYALPSSRDLAAASSHLKGLAKEDLQISATPDGWWISPRAAIEMELLRLQQMPVARTTRYETKGRAVGHAGPDGFAWQDHFNIKITFDARRITKKTSQTEVMMHIFRKGKEGSELCQNALCIRTLAVWTGKDSRANVQANTVKFFEEVQSLGTEGVHFNVGDETFLGQWQRYSDLPEEEKAGAAGNYRKVSLRFWFPADMAAQCAAIGHGCAGNNFCAHCYAKQDERHLPYTLITVDRSTNFMAFAHQYDMHARTLFAINTREDYAKVQLLTKEGLCQSTAMDAEARARLQAAADESTGARRAPRRSKKAPVVMDHPEEDVLRELVGWRSGHTETCVCKVCMIPQGTRIRVIPRFGFQRPSDFLSKHCPVLSADRMPFCALHCLMRVTEALVQQICQAALCSSRKSAVIERLNAALKREGISRSYKQSESGSWEKITLEGHQAKRLLEKSAAGQMRIERVLESMWPGSSQDAGVEGTYGIQYVPRTVALWRQWGVVVNLMTERYPAALLEDVVDGANGFARFGRECRDFIFRLQSMYVEDYSKSYYLHTILHHAGDFMRALEAEGMCLGMMSNSGAERRHEYGRRAARKALACSGWRKRSAEFDKKPNLLAFLTLTEILGWQYGEDLISHEIARRAAGHTPMDAGLEENTPAVQGPRRKNSNARMTLPMRFSVASRRSLASENQDTSSASTEAPFLSEEELRSEDEADPYSEPPCFETMNNPDWARVPVGDKETAYALIGVSGLTEENVNALKDPERYSKLFSHVPVDCLSDASDLGSECQDEFWTLDINSFDFPDEDTEDGDYMSSGPEQFDEEEDILMEVDSTESGPCSNEAVGKPGPKYAFRHLAKTGAANATIAAAEPEVPGRRTAAELSPAKAPQCKAARTSAAVLGSNAGLSVSLSPNSLSEISVSDPLAPSSYAAVTATNPVPSLFSGGASAVQDDDGVRRRFQPRGGGRKKR